MDISDEKGSAAGLAYAIIILPGVDFFFYFLLQTLWESVGESLKLKIAVLFVYIAMISMVLAALFFSILYHPSILNRFVPTSEPAYQVRSTIVKGKCHNHDNVSDGGVNIWWW